jgi:hypothetical protein
METPAPVSDAAAHRAMVIGWALVRHYARRTNLPAEQLEDFAADGLLRAWDKYDPAVGVPFHCFARLHIRYAILEGLRVRNVHSVWHFRRLRGRMKRLHVRTPVPRRPDEITEYDALVRRCQDAVCLEGTPRQRALLDALVEGASYADVMRAWGVTAPAVTHHLNVVRALLYPILHSQQERA